VIVPKPGAEAVVKQILDFAGERLADFKIPQYMVIRRDPLPRNPGGKILKSCCERGRTGAGRCANRPPPTTPPVRDGPGGC
jgi:acyl-CoA synthetase (AMP-forming)/AMP-acid ligase II